MSKQILDLKCSSFLFPSTRPPLRRAVLSWCSESPLKVKPVAGPSGAFVPKVNDGLPQRAQHPSPVERQKNKLTGTVPWNRPWGRKGTSELPAPLVGAWRSQAYQALCILCARYGLTIPFTPFLSISENTKVQNMAWHFQHSWKCVFTERAVSYGSTWVGRENCREELYQTIQSAPAGKSAVHLRLTMDHELNQSISSRPP